MKIRRCRSFTGPLGLLRSTTLTGSLLLSAAHTTPAQAVDLDTGETLSVSSDTEIGVSAESIGFNGGTLRNTAAFTTVRDIILNAAGGTFQTDADLTVGGAITGTGGALTKTGAGTLTLTGDASGFAGDLNVRAGTLDIGAQLDSVASVIDTDGIDPNATATVRVAGSGIWTSEYLSVGADHHGALIVEDGGQVISGIGAIGSDNAGSTGSTLVSGSDSTWTINGGTLIGYYGKGSLDIKDGGRVISTALSPTPFSTVIGGNPNVTGTVNVVDSGSLWTNDATVSVGFLGNGVLTVAQGGQVSVSGAGNSVTLANQAGSSGTLNIGAASGEAAQAAGTIDAPSVAFGLGAGTLVFNHLGNPDASDLIFSPSLTGLGTILHESGTTVLAADNSGFTGTTNITGGTLRVGDGSGNDALGGTVVVGKGATPGVFGTLGGSGTVGATTVEDGGHIAPGNSVGKLTVAGDLTLLAGAVLDYELGSAGTAGNPTSGVSDLIEVQGNLALDGAINLAQSGNAADGAVGLGYYRLMTYGGTLSGDGLTVGTVPYSGSGSYAITAGGGNVDLFAPAPGIPGDDTLQHWQGGDGTWNAANATWLNQGGDTLVAWGGKHAVFKNQPGGFDGGTIAVEGAQGFKGLQFVDSGYRLEGTGTLEVDGSDSGDGNAEIRVLAGETANIATTISGTGGITKTQDGTLVLEGNNTYQGGTAISGGTLSVSSDANLGAASGGLTFNGGTLQNTATFTTTRNVTLGAGGGALRNDALLEMAGTVSGAGSLIKDGAFKLLLSGANTYAGGTLIKQGAVEAAVTGALGTGPVNVGGYLLFSDSASAGDLNITVDQGYLDFFEQSSAGNATIVNNADSRIQFIGDSTADNATVINNAGGLVSIANRADDIAIGSLSGDGTVDLGSHALTLGGLGKNDTLGGTIKNGASSIGGSLIKAGMGTLTLTGANTYTGGTTVNAGTLQLGNGGTGGSIVGDVRIAPAGTFAFNRGDNFAFGGVFTGGGALDMKGAGRVDLTGNSAAFAGTTNINAGTLSVNGALGGALNVMSGGRLQGTGTVGTTTIASGATIAPGNSIGTLTVDGDIAFAAGSIYEAEINPALDGDLIDASGRATINGGTVHAVKAGGVYTPGSRWTIIGADGGVTGTFGNLTQNMPFVDLALAYDANKVYIDATRNATSFCDAAQTGNQCATGNGLESTGTGNPLYDVFAALPDKGSARQALAALSGEIHASTKSALIEDSHFVRDAMNDRLRAAFQGVGASAAPVLAYGQGGPALASPAAPGRIAAWGKAFGSWGSFDGNGDAAGLDTSTGGFFTGVDGLVNDKVRLGAMAGYSHTSFDADGQPSSGSSENYHLGLYGGTQWDKLALRSGLGYTWHDVKTSRSVAFTGFADRLKGGYKAGTFQAFGELGYRLDTPAVSFEPYANLAYVNLKTDGLVEEGGAAALTSRGETSDTVFTTLGLRASTGFTLGAMNATAHGALGWRHAYGDIVPTSRHAFSGGDAFTIAGVPIAKDSAVISAGLDFNLTETATFGIAYQGQLASDAREHGVNARLNVKF